MSGFSIINHRWDQRSYFVRVGDAISQLINVVLLNGMPDESVSGRSYFNTVIAEREGRPVRTVWKVVRFLAETLFYYRDRGDHTRLAFIEDIERAGLRYEAAIKYTRYASGSYTECLLDYRRRRHYTY